MLRSEHHQVGDIVAYKFNDARHEHVIHGVRYEEENGERVNVRYLMRLEFKEHAVELPPEHFFKPGTDLEKLGQAVRDAQAAREIGDHEKAEQLNNEAIEPFIERDEEILKARAQKYHDEHEHHWGCPIIEREVPHSDVIEKVGEVPLPVAE